jgi:hypothetical protein
MSLSVIYITILVSFDTFLLTMSSTTPRKVKVKDKVFLRFN